MYSFVAIACTTVKDVVCTAVWLCVASSSGYCAWRDPLKPTQLLARMCREHKLDGPVYGRGCVRIAGCVFHAVPDLEDESGESRYREEVYAVLFAA